MESWMITLGLTLAGLVAGYAVMKNTVSNSVEADIQQDVKISELDKFMNSTLPAIEHYSRIEIAYGRKIDYFDRELIELKTKMSQSPTMKEVREEFVSKEVYLQMEKHIDEKFHGLQSGISDILKELKDK